MNTRGLLIIALALWPALTADAAVISRDWKTPGDGLLTYDTVNRREWLDLSQTVLNSQFPGTDREAKYEYVVGQTGPGGLFEGLTVAKVEDATALAQSAGVDTSTLSYDVNANTTTALIQLLSVTALFPTRNSAGLLDELNSSMTARKRAVFFIDARSQAGLAFGSEIDLLQFPPPGVFLFRQVPEPRRIILAAFVFLLPPIFRSYRR
jgi:hypothetical protein